MSVIDEGFEWAVDPSYLWLSGRRVGLLAKPDDQPQPFLVSSVPGNRRVYRPFVDHDGLFHTFAFTDPTEDGIKAFAERYGPLRASSGGTFVPRFLYENPPRPPVEQVGEPLTTWQTEILKMRRLIELFDVFREDELGERKWWATPPQPPDPDAELPDVLAHLFRTATATRLQKESANASAAVVHEVNIELIAGGSLWGVVPLIDTQRGLLLRPTSLRDALWLQFADAITSGASFRLCKNCENTWFRVRRKKGPEPARQFCSHRCKMAARRSDLGEIATLHADGASIQELSERFGMSILAIRKHVESKRSL